MSASPCSTTPASRPSGSACCWPSFPGKFRRKWSPCGNSSPPGCRECLRYDGPIQRISRVVTTDFELRGKTLRRGQRIWAMQGAANRDPQQFPKPDRFDILRRNNRHVAFGYGVHHCLGAPLARIEGQIAFLALLRLPDLQLENPAPEWQEGVSLRTPKSLPVRFRAG